VVVVTLPATTLTSPPPIEAGRIPKPRLIAVMAVMLEEIFLTPYEADEDQGPEWVSGTRGEREETLKNLCRGVSFAAIIVSLQYLQREEGGQE
jgi:hypothetical protein